MKTAVARFLCCTALALVVGCERAEPLRWQPSEAVLKLPAELQTDVEKTLSEYCGTHASPKLLTDPAADPRHLQHGQAVYLERCVQCHGVTGDGNGPVAASMYPRPRDYRKGVFKFTSTPYGSKPRRSDLVRTVGRGVVGTSMPAFERLADRDLQAVVDYVLVLTHRGELENELAFEADFEGELDPEYVPDYVDDIKSQWEQAELNVVTPLTSRPQFTAETVQLGKQAFLKEGCSKCHAEDGRGHTPGNIGKDSWGFATRAADLTSGMLHGGAEPLDIYRRIISGINGTPMPGFRNAFRDEPETIWHLVSYVEYVSNRRRTGHVPPAGLLKPYAASGAAPQADGGESGG